MGHPFTFIAVQNALLPLTDFIEDPTMHSMVGKGIHENRGLGPLQPHRGQRYYLWWSCYLLRKFSHPYLLKNCIYKRLVEPPGFEPGILTPRAPAGHQDGVEGLSTDGPKSGLVGADGFEPPTSQPKGRARYLRSSGSAPSIIVSAPRSETKSLLFVCICFLNEVRESAASVPCLTPIIYGAKSLGE